MDNKTPSITHLFSGLLAILLLVTVTACSAPPEKSETPPPEEPKQAPVSAPEPQPEPEAAPKPLVLKPDYPERYVVVKGDTLWDISERFLRDPWLWPQLWQNNPQVTNPHLIYPGDVLTMYFIDGRPVLHIERVKPGIPVVKLEPKVREESLRDAIPTIPLDALAQFLTRPRVVTKEQLESAPYIVATSDEHLLAATGSKVYARKVDPSEANEYVIVRPDRKFTNKKGELLGYETVYLADATLLEPGDPATLRITKAKREVFEGNRLFTLDEQIMQNFQPHAPKEQVKGQIVAVVGGVSRVGQFQMIVVDLGHDDGMEPGVVLATMQAGGEVRDVVTGDMVTLPDERSGIAMVFKVFDRVSYALVMESRRSIKRWDSVSNP